MAGSTVRALDAFKMLEPKLMDSPALVLPQAYKQYIVETDVFAHALVALLLQQKQDTNLNECT